MHVDAARLSVMDLAAHYCRVSIRLHLETCYPVPVDVAALKVALQREPESRTPDSHQCLCHGQNYILLSLEMQYASIQVYCKLQNKDIFREKKTKMNSLKWL